MNWPFDDGSDLPLRDGFDVGGAQERKMASMVGGYSGIRTVEELNPDGSITILRTRGGRPIFETTAVRRSSQAQKYRGFVAKIPTRAVLFDPYTLDILDANYQPAVNTYSVQDFATSWNVPTDDDTDWYDVVIFDGTQIKVNAKAMPTLGITANHGYPAIPYVINRETAEDQYGNAERNTTEKRVFAVGRYSVTSWGGGGVTETLTPTAPRTEDRAMTIGQRVDHATNTAWLGQLYHPASGWDAAGEWYFTSAEITMLLASAHLVKVAGSANVAMTPPALVDQGPSSGSITVDTTLPDGAEISLVGSPVHNLDRPYNHPGGGPGGDSGFQRVNWPWTGVVTAALNGEVYGTYSRTSYSGSALSSEVQSGRVIDYASENYKQWDVRNEQTRQKDYNHVFAATPTNTNGSEMGANSTTLWWGQHAPTGWDPSQLGPVRGKNYKDIDAYNISGSSVTGRQYEEQSGAFSVTVGGVALVEGSFTRNKSSGSKAVLSPILGRYDGYFLPGPGYAAGWGTIYYYAGLGIGGYGRATFTFYVSPASDITPIYEYYKNPTGSLQDPSATDDINSKYYSGVAALMGQTMYDNEDADGHYGKAYYTASINPSVTLDTSTMSLSSKDFLLYDETNGVYISVEGEFVGVDTAATLTVILKVQTRHHTITQTLGEYSYTYSQLVQEREIGTTGKYAMPSPQIRAIFAPMFQEQGSFKGAHYVTAEEESNGATPAHLFNFVLYPEPYSAIGTLNATNDEGHAIHFVPCNLLEMLYAFVFSQEYGVAEDGTRYPVTFTARYNDMMSTLFSSAYRVSVRDGVQGNWSDSLGADFASISTVSLHRT